MSASSIPNLLSLRGGARGGRGRGRGRGGHQPGQPTGTSQGHDAVIQGTDNDAALSRLSAVEMGYLEDSFAQYFVRGGGPAPPTRRLPIINRGTYTRTAALDNLIDLFLSGDDAGSSPPEKQIISLGAGTDTRSLRMFSQQSSPPVTYHEVDFPTICKQKLTTVSASPRLRQILPDPVVLDGGSWRTRSACGSDLWCHGIDLRHLAQAEDTSVLQGLKTDVPTLLVSECCLCYLQTSEAGEVIKWFTDRIPNLGIIIYEPIKPDDPFGRMMVSNLAARGIRMPTLEKYREPRDQEGRLRDAGFDHVRQMTVDEIWEKWIPETEKERVDGLEGLDEVEEWKLLAGHYIVAWAWKGTGFGSWLR